MLKTKEKKLVESVFTTYLEDRREQREKTLHLPNLGMIPCLKISTGCVPLLPMQVTRNKANAYSYTIWDSISLDIGFLATAVKNLFTQGYSAQHQNDQQRNDCVWSLTEF